MVDRNTIGMSGGESAEAIVARIQADVARRRDSSNELSAEQVVSNSDPEVAKSVAREDQAKNVRLADLVAFDGDDFTANVYRTLFNRLPDPDGANYVNHLLADGTRKVEIVGRLRFSKEGRARGVRVAGLLPRFAVLMACRMPILGSMIDTIVSLITLVRHDRIQRINAHKRFEATTKSEHVVARSLVRIGQLEESSEALISLGGQVERQSAGLRNLEGSIKKSLAPFFERIEAVAETTAAEIRISESRRAAEGTAREVLGAKISLVLDHIGVLKNRIEVESAGREALRQQIGSVNHSLAEVDLRLTQVSRLREDDAKEFVTIHAGLSKLDGIVSGNLAGSISLALERVDDLEVRFGSEAETRIGDAEIVAEHIDALREEVRVQLASEAESRIGASEAVGGSLEALREDVREKIASEAESRIEVFEAVEESLEALREKVRVQFASEAEGRIGVAEVAVESLAALREEIRVQFVSGEEKSQLAEVRFLGLTDEQGAIAQRLENAERSTTSLKRESVEHDRRLRIFLEHATRRLPDPLDSAALETFAEERDHQLDALYVDFEDTFRGSRADIKQRQTAYLPAMKACGAGTSSTPILDLGCGRGEWLELLKDGSIEARGVEQNKILHAQCLERGLDVSEGNLIDYLREQQNGSVGAVTAFHVVEHLPLEQVIGLLDEAIRVLRPGGILLLETPNPENVQVGSHLFYLDPTHRNPIPSRTLQFLAESRGFSSTEILPCHPFPETDRIAASDKASELIDRFFFGPQDYAFIGTKA